MLAQLDYRLPSGRLRGYEPKPDGFRGLLWHRSAGQAQVLSRNARELGHWFPELTRAARALPPDTLIDGEIVICADSGWVDFGSLQAGLGTARTTVATAASGSICRGVPASSAVTARTRSAAFSEMSRCASARHAASSA
jgi:ATP-dependent DNA ligase